MVEAAQKITTASGPLRERFERIAKRRGPKIAKVAVARQILTLLYYDGLAKHIADATGRRGALARSGSDELPHQTLLAAPALHHQVISARADVAVACRHLSRERARLTSLPG